MLKQMKEHILIVEALTYDATPNETMAYNTFRLAGLLKADGSLNRPKILAELRDNKGARIRGVYGMGDGAWKLLMKMMLESA